MDATGLLLVTVLRHRIKEADFEAGYEHFQRLTGAGMDRQAFQDAVAAALSSRLIHDPVRLPEGALQCHWHLELTSAGQAAARRIATNTSPE